jgi:hypothetical protein
MTRLTIACAWKTLSVPAASNRSEIRTASPKSRMRPNAYWRQAHLESVTVCTLGRQLACCYLVNCADLVDSVPGRGFDSLDNGTAQCLKALYCSLRPNPQNGFRFFAEILKIIQKDLLRNGLHPRAAFSPDSLSPW